MTEIKFQELGYRKHLRSQNPAELTGVNKKPQIMMCQGAILGDIWFKYVITVAFLGLCDKRVTLKQECQGILDLDSSSNPTLQLST